MEGLTTVTSFVWTQFSSALTTASDNVIMLVPLGVGTVGAAIGLFKRAVKIGGRRR